MIQLELKKAIHTTDGNQILDIAFEVPKNGLITLFGKSGVGKTTLLRMIAGLLTPESGRIQVGNEVWFDSAKKINVKPQKRNIGFVFQDYALFPNMTVKQHLLFAQKEKSSEQADELLEIFHLTGLTERKPQTLSGGQMQRLAVARALARKPEVLLLDEPLSALDEETRRLLQDEIIQAHQKIGSTTILVSHDRAEVIRLSDRIYRIEAGIIVASGTADEFFGLDSQERKFTAQVVEVTEQGAVILVNGEKIAIKNTEADISPKIGDCVIVTLNDIGIHLP